MVQLKRRVPKHKRPYPLNKSAWWQTKDRIQHEYQMMRYNWRDFKLELLDIIEQIKNK